MRAGHEHDQGGTKMPRFGRRMRQPIAAPPHSIAWVSRASNVRFDANVTGGLPWKFEPERNSVEVKLGQVVTVLFSVTNQSARETVGQASYNVAPPTVGQYFSKINCFCFTEQRLKPGERREMTVVFFVDPELAKDPDDDDLNTITLSYTMYPVREPPKGVADSGPGRS